MSQSEDIIIDNGIPLKIFVNCQRFVSTIQVDLVNINIKIEDLIKLLEPTSSVIALDCNFGHKIHPGFEHLLKKKKPKTNKKVYGKPRKCQGDGTCFSSAIGPAIIIDNLKIPKGKVYYPKCFPTGGYTQVPGILLDDNSDGIEVLNIWVNFLNKSLGRSGENAIRYENMRSTMENYKCNINIDTNAFVLNLYDLTKIIKIYENITEKNIGEHSNAADILIIPPYLINEVHGPIEKYQISFKISDEGSNKSTTMRIGGSGKITILNAKNSELVNKMIDFLDHIFRVYWNNIVQKFPATDYELGLIPEDGVPLVP